MIVYHDTVSCGYSTGSALGHFKDLKSRNVLTTAVSSATTARFSQVLKRADNKIHHQSKVGNRLIFAEVEVALDKNAVHRMIISGPVETASMLTARIQTQVIVIDLTTMRNHIITGPSELDWLDSFRKQLAGQQN